VDASTGAVEVWLHNILDFWVMLVIPPSTPVAAWRPPLLGMSSLIGPHGSLVGVAKVALPHPSILSLVSTTIAARSVFPQARCISCLKAALLTPTQMIAPPPPPCMSTPVFILGIVHFALSLVWEVCMIHKCGIANILQDINEI
jgi:hypothetical protein